jgi:hypothetical protein
MGMAILKSQEMQEPDFYSDGKFKLVRSLDKYVNVLGEYIEI